MNKQEEQKLREEFAEYLRHNWEERETLPVADWWLNKMKEQREKMIEEIENRLNECAWCDLENGRGKYLLESDIKSIIKNKE